MTLDEELRQALHSQARSLAPSPDPLAGIERRARSLRRRRAAAAVTSTALAVLAVAGVGTALVPDGTDRTGPIATSPAPSPTASPSPPSASPSAAASTPASVRPSGGLVLDPARPWAYRGTPVDAGTLATFRRDWAARHPGSELVPLFGQVYEPSQRLELVFLGRGGDQDRWGVMTTSESGSDVRYETALPEGARSLAAPLGGDEVGRLLLVAAPVATTARYAPDGVAYRAMSRTPSEAAGVFVTALDGDSARDRYRVLGPQGDVVDDAQAPDLSASGATPDEGPGTGQAPANVLEWPSRGTVTGEVVLAARAAYAQSRRASDPGRVLEKVLFAGDDDAGNRYLLAQMWLEGDTTADTVGWVDGPGSEEPELQLKSRVTDGAEVLALYVQRAPGQTTDTLVVVPRPGTGQVLYGEEGSEWQAVGMPSYLDGVALVDRLPDAEGDRIRLLDGDGTLFFEDEVQSLLCGVTSCS